MNQSQSQPIIMSAHPKVKWLLRLMNGNASGDLSIRLRGSNWSLCWFYTVGQ